MLDNLSLKIIRKMDCIDLVKIYFKKGNFSKLKKVKSKESRKFVNWCLSKDFFEIGLPLVLNILEVIEGIIPKEELDEMAINSNFMNGLSESVIYRSFTEHKSKTDLALLSTLLTSRIYDNKRLIELINGGFSIDKDYAFRRLVEVKDINLLKESDLKLRNYKDRKELLKRIMGSDLYTIENKKKYILETGMGYNSEVVINHFLKLYEKVDSDNKNKVIESFIEIVKSNQNRIDTNDMSDDRTGEYIEGYKDYAYQMFLTKNMPLNMKNDIAKVLLETRNYEFIYEWFMWDIECTYNYNLIDALMLEDENVVKNLLFAINSNYIEYATMKLLNRDEEFVVKVMELMASKVEYCEIDFIDKILDIIYYKYYDFKLSINAAFNLILAKSKFTPKYMSEYNFNGDMRNRILKTYKLDEDFLTVYVPYLTTGDKSKLLDWKEAIEKLKELRTKRLKVRESNKKLLERNRKKES